MLKAFNLLPLCWRPNTCLKSFLRALENFGNLLIAVTFDGFIGGAIEISIMANLDGLGSEKLRRSMALLSWFSMICRSYSSNSVIGWSPKHTCKLFLGFSIGLGLGLGFLKKRMTLISIIHREWSLYERMSLKGDLTCYGGKGKHKLASHDIENDNSSILVD